MVYEHLSTEELAQQVRARQNWLEKVTNFVETLVQERGKILCQRQGSSSVYILRSLTDFEGFSFVVESGYTTLEGNEVAVHYHSGMEYWLLDPRHSSSLKLQLCYQTDHLGCLVRHFEIGDWQSTLDYIMEHKDEAVARFDHAKAQHTARQQAEQTEQQQRAQLIWFAQRLKI